MDLGRAGATLGLRPEHGVEDARRRYLQLTEDADPQSTDELDQALLAYVLAEPAAEPVDPRTTGRLRQVGIGVAVLGILAIALAATLPLLRSAVLQRSAVGPPTPSTVAGIAVPANARECPFTDKDTDVRRPGLTETRYCLPGVSSSHLRQWYAREQPATKPWPGWIACGGTRLTVGAQQVQWATPAGERRGYVVPAASSPAAFVVVFTRSDGGCE